MRYIRQFTVILLLSFLGEGLHRLLPLPIPASIYGMALLFAGLCTKVIRLEAVRETGRFLLEIMPLMFIPAGVGLMASWDVLRPMVLPAAAVIVLVLLAVFGVSGRVTEGVMGAEKRRGGHE